MGNPATIEPAECFHCGAACPDRSIADGDRFFCCHGCKTVYGLLRASGLTRFYDLDKAPGVRLAAPVQAGRFDFLDAPAVRQRLLDFSDGRTARATFRVPAIHCIACVWLLENLFRLRPGIGRSVVNFPRKEVTVTFDETVISPSRVVELLASLGYEPQLHLHDLERNAPDRSHRSLVLKLGIAGFAFGNIMLMSFPAYLGLSKDPAGQFGPLFGWLSMALALPVLLYSASDYWRAAWLGLRRRVLTIDFPISLGIAALFLESLREIATGAGPGYLDSFTGLIFFLLVGRWFQRRTYDTLSFDRDYKAYFPLSVVRREKDGERIIPITDLKVGDRVVVRHGELIPADCRLVAGEGYIDYSFITGESTPATRLPGDHLYAGGRQAGGAIEAETVKEVSQGYLASLWDGEAFRKRGEGGVSELTDRVSRWFTGIVVLVASAAAGWWLFEDPAKALRVFSAVLIVACPCALALAAPFTLGTAMRLLGRSGLFLRNAHVLETMAKLDAVIFDKTGTLTHAARSDVAFEGEPLFPEDRARLASLARHSTHPLSRRIAEAWADAGVQPASSFREAPARGIAAEIGGVAAALGSRAWLSEQGIAVPEAGAGSDGSSVWAALDGRCRGRFVLRSAYREDVSGALARLARRYELAVLSGDTARERATLEGMLGRGAQAHFEQSPADKMGYVSAMQAGGRRVMMIGDGLNDAGALRQSDVGVALAEDIGAFSPACDGILEASALGRLPDFMAFSRKAMRIISACFALSFIYNVLGVGFAARGLLSPLVSAILMPISSVSVVALAVGATTWAARRAKSEIRSSKSETNPSRGK